MPIAPASTLYSSYINQPESPIEEALRFQTEPLNVEDLPLFDFDMRPEDFHPGSPGMHIKPDPDQAYNGLYDSEYNQHNLNHHNFDSINPAGITMNQGPMNGQGFSGNPFQNNSRITDDDLFGSLDTSHVNNGFNPNFQQDQYLQPNQQQQMFSHPSEHAGHQGSFLGSVNAHQFSGSVPHTAAYTGFNPMNAPAHQVGKLQRQYSDSRSPMTPKTPAISGGNFINTPESSSFPRGHHTKSISGNWPIENGTPNTMVSVDSPLSSPINGGGMHNHISEMMRSGKQLSLPAKVDGNGIGTQDLKKKRRRESHNAVERRRRDNINERIQDLSRLVPNHRLDDEKVRKHLSNNGPLSPTLGASSFGASPPAATSLLAGGSGRRATSGGVGSITTGLPLEEKDKGPNKGDILNGAVSWMHDLLWMSSILIKRNQDLMAKAQQAGLNDIDFNETEEEKRMLSELQDAFQKSGAEHFRYTRAPGSGLRVPNHTTLTGEALNVNGMGTPSSLSPGIQSGGSGANSGQQQYPHPYSLKEEDEYTTMDLY